MTGNPEPPYLELVDTLIEHWKGLSVPMSKDSAESKGAPRSPGEPATQRAYLLFNRWEGNPLAEDLELQFPKWARDRFTVPDRQFEDRAEHAPFVLELPEELILLASDFQSQGLCNWLARCLAFSAHQVKKRTLAQDFCGVVISPASARAITHHWVSLGDQRPPHGEESVLFRYHDPRVMQRVWSALSAFQQSRWLGPVTHWWSLLQPWGPFSDTSEPVQWFHAKAPVLSCGAEAGGSARDLFDEAQWFLAGTSPQANLIWRSYADNNVPSEAQPDPDNLMLMLADAARMKLEELNLEDYVWITWMHAPKSGPARALDWSLPHLSPTLSRIEAQLQDDPDARFSSLFANATRPRR